MKYLVRKYFIVVGVELLSEKIAFKISCVKKFQERIALAFILKWPYIWVQKVGILRWLVADQQVSYLCKFLENVNQSLNIEGYLPVDRFTDEKNIF